MIRLEGARLPEEARGRVVPVLIGDEHEDVIGIPLQVGYACVLATNCGIQTPDPNAIPPVPAANPVIEISGPMMETIRKYVPSSGVIQIDSEWLSYSAFLTNPYRLVIMARGLGATDAAQHAKGATIIFVEAHPLYVFAWNPPGHSYPSGAVVEVRVNDSTEVPFHTIRLQDTRPVTGERLLTVEFDLTRGLVVVPGGVGSGASNIVAISGGAPTEDETRARQAARDPITKAVDRKRRRLRRQGRIPRYREPMPIAGGAGVVGFQGSLPLAGAVKSPSTVPDTSWHPGDPLRKVPVLGPPPPPVQPPSPPSRPASARAVGSVAGSATPQPVRLLTLPLGRVTATIRGLADSSTARLGEGANAILIHPAPITKLILEETFGHTEREAAVWEATHARQVGLGITWRFVWYGEGFETFRSLAGYCGQADLFVNDDGRFEYKFRARQAAVDATITERELVGEVSLGWTDFVDLATRLDVTWGTPGQTHTAGGSFMLDSPLQARYGVKPKPLDLPWVASESAARLVGRYWLGQKDHPRMVAALNVTPFLAAITRTDRVMLDTPLVNRYTGKSIPFIVRGTTDRGAERVFTCIEADPRAAEVLAYGTLVLTRTVGVPAYGTLTITTDVPTLWRCVLPGDLLLW